MAREINRWEKNVFGDLESQKSLECFEEMKESQRGGRFVRGAGENG